MLRRAAAWRCARSCSRRALLALPAAALLALLLHARYLDAPPAQPGTPPADDAKPEAYIQVLTNEVVPPSEETLEFFNSRQTSDRPWYMQGGEARPKSGATRPPMFPEEAPTDDRIQNQLMYVPKDNEDDEPRKVKKILLANGAGAWGLQGGKGEFVKNKCPVSDCEITSDMRDASSADAVLFKDHYVALNAVRPAHQIWILYYLECPYHTPALRMSDAFNWTATYRRDSDLVAPYERWVYHDPKVTQVERLEKNYAANKTKKVAWFVSNCHARNHRLQYARALAKHVSVDIYGACGSRHCPRNDPDCLAMLVRDYKFYLAFENSNCKDYITEKFFVNGLGHDVLPIVMGARPSEYEAVAPRNSYIHVEEFASPAELADYINLLDRDDELYNSYFKWKGTGEFINTYFFCRVCALLHAENAPRRRYADAHAWWREGTCTRGEWREATPRDSAAAAATNATIHGRWIRSDRRS